MAGNCSAGHTRSAVRGATMGRRTKVGYAQDGGLSSYDG